MLRIGSRTLVIDNSDSKNIKAEHLDLAPLSAASSSSNISVSYSFSIEEPEDKELLSPSDSVSALGLSYSDSTSSTSSLQPVLTRSFNKYARSRVEEFKSPTMAQNHWMTRYYPLVYDIINHPAPSSHMVALLLGPKAYMVHREYKQACQEREMSWQRLQDEQAFYSRIYKIVCLHEDKHVNEAILKRYRDNVINALEKKEENYKAIMAAGRTLTRDQYEDLVACKLHMQEYEIVLAQHTRGYSEQNTKISSHYHKFMQETFQEEHESKSSNYLTFQQKVLAYAQHQRVAYSRPTSLSISSILAGKLQMQLEYDMKADIFQKPLLDDYAEKLKQSLQQTKAEKSNELPENILQQRLQEDPLKIHKDFLTKLYDNFFMLDTASPLKVFVDKHDISKFRLAIEKRINELTRAVAQAQAMQVKLDAQYSQGLAEKINVYRQAVETRIRQEGDMVWSYLTQASYSRRTTATKLVEDITSTGIHMFPLRRVKDLISGDSLLHIVLAAYIQATPRARVELRYIFEELLQRGCDLLAVNKAGQTPFAYANSLLPKPVDAREFLPDWELLKLAFAYHPTYSPAQKRVKQVALSYFELRQSFFRTHLTAFYNQRISQVTRREQMTMALDALVIAARSIDDQALKGMISAIAAMPLSQGKLLTGLRGVNIPESTTTTESKRVPAEEEKKDVEIKDTAAMERRLREQELLIARLLAERTTGSTAPVSGERAFTPPAPIAGNNSQANLFTPLASPPLQKSAAVTATASAAVEISI